MQYRLYFFDERRHVVQAITIEAADDGDAIAQAAAKSDGRAMELWRDALRVMTFHQPGSPPG